MKGLKDKNEKHRIISFFQTSSKLILEKKKGGPFSGPPLSYIQ
jgi:hypothetical protein